MLEFVRASARPRPRHRPPPQLQPQLVLANAHRADASNTQARPAKLRRRKQLTSRRQTPAGDARVAVRRAAASAPATARPGDSIETLCRRPTIARLKSASPGEFKSRAILSRYVWLKARQSKS